MSSQQDIYVIGCGGHAKVVLATLQAAGHVVKAIFDDDKMKWGKDLWGIPVTGAPSELEGLSSPQAIIAIGENRARKTVAQRFPRVEWLTAVHPTAYLHPSVRLGPGSVVFAGAVIQLDTSIGTHSIINTAAAVDHDCVVGDYVHIAPGVRVAGGVRLGEGVLMGIGSAVIPCVSVGSWSVVGAGGVVVSDLAENVLAVGVPARPVQRREH